MGARDGAQRSAIPVVPWAQLITGQPPFGALPLGTETVPETATALPSIEVERYRTSVVLPAFLSELVIVRDQMTSPWRDGSVLGGV